MNKQIPQKNSVTDQKSSEVQKRKAVIAYSVVAIAITLLLGTISILNLSYLPGLFIKACQLLAFMICGAMHVSFLNKNISFPGTKFPTNNKLVFSIFLSVIMSIALMLLYVFTDSNMIGMSIACSSSFLVPFVLTRVWETYNDLPQKRYKLWYNSDVVMDSRTTVFLNSLPIRLRLAMKYFDIKDEEFELTVPGHTQFGKFFNQFIIEKNKVNPAAIECFDMEKKPFGWQFYVEQLGGLKKQFIDPELSLRENKVKDHSTITAKRQRTDEFIEEKPLVTETKVLPQLNRTTIKTNKHEAGK